jgi:DNA repair exonuclease SbcCD nuclease subunit
MGLMRILFLADTHLGFDFPLHPRIQRRRRGPEFFANFERALAPALHNRVDGVVHGGDLFYRSKVPPKLVEMAFEPFKKVAALGIPVYLVPGNHERAAIPHAALARHPDIHIFDRPRTYILQKNGFSLALAGFPFVAGAIRKDLRALLDQTGWHHAAADVSVLCMHQAVDGATVGPGNFMFRYSADVVRSADIPAGFSAVLCGHIHRFQVLNRDLKGKPLAATVFYPGSIDRVSFAERNEKKGYLVLAFDSDNFAAGSLKHWTFHELPVRPMLQLELNATGMARSELQAWIETTLAALPADSIVKLNIHGEVSQNAMQIFQASSLRSLAPPAMNIHTTLVDDRLYPTRTTAATH